MRVTGTLIESYCSYLQVSGLLGSMQSPASARPAVCYLIPVHQIYLYSNLTHTLTTDCHHQSQFCKKPLHSSLDCKTPPHSASSPFSLLSLNLHNLSRVLRRLPRPTEIVSMHRSGEGDD